MTTRATWVERLVQVLPPPSEPASLGRTWEDVERDVGVRFPEEFRVLMDTYGTGAIGNELSILDPRSPRWLRFVEGLHRAMREDFYADDEPPPLPGFPAPDPSLLMVSHNGNGDQLFLVVDDGVASETEVWLGNYRGLDWMRLDGPVPRILWDVLTGQGQAHAIIERFGSYTWSLAPTFASAPAESATG